MSLVASQVVILLQKAKRPLTIPVIANALELDAVFVAKRIEEDPRMRLIFTRKRILEKAKVALKDG